MGESFAAVIKGTGGSMGCHGAREGQGVKGGCLEAHAGGQGGVWSGEEAGEDMPLGLDQRGSDVAVTRMILTLR